MRSLERTNPWRQKVGWWVPGLEEGDGELVLHGDRVSVWEDEKVLEIMVVALSQYECT